MLARRPRVRPSLLDRAIASISPRAGLERLQARAYWAFLTGQYTGARSDRRQTQNWNPLASSADADTIPDLPVLRARGEDLLRNAPLAAGAVKTFITNIVGPGLSVYPRIDRELLGLSEDAADAWERLAKRIWQAVARSRALDIAGRLTFAGLTRQYLWTTMARGDVLIVRRQHAASPLTTTAFQLVEADRLRNPLGEVDRPGYAAGVETDEDGRLVQFHVSDRHPHEDFLGGATKWRTVPAMGPETGEPIAWLSAHLSRPGQTRGVPLFAPVIEPLKGVDEYAGAELLATVLSSYFTVFVKTEDNAELLGAGVSPGTDPTTGAALPLNYKLGRGAVVRMRPGDDIAVANPTRPSDRFAPFIEAMAQQIGAGIEMPFELLLKRFMASYSASQASRLEFGKVVETRRADAVADFCQPIYEAVIAEAVAREWLAAPGFFDDPFVRQAWLGTRWSGKTLGSIDATKDVAAARERVDAGFSTIEEETLALTGGDWEQNHQQQVKERRARERDGLLGPSTPSAPASGTDASAAANDQRDHADAATTASSMERYAHVS